MKSMKNNTKNYLNKLMIYAEKHLQNARNTINDGDYFGALGEYRRWVDCMNKFDDLFEVYYPEAPRMYGDLRKRVPDMGAAMKALHFERSCWDQELADLLGYKGLEEWKQARPELYAKEYLN